MDYFKQAQVRNEIKKYPVQHPLLKKYIKFFWELHIDYTQLNHKIIPQRNINLRINLSETPHYANINDKEHLLEDVYFFGLQDHFGNVNLKICGKVDVIGICFYPDGFYPFLKIPISEFKNQLLGANEVGFKSVNNIKERLKGINSVEARLKLLETKLILLLKNDMYIPEKFRQLFHELQCNHNTLKISEFCKHNNIGIRKLERMYNKYVGMSANTYTTLNRFHKSTNQILHTNYSKLSDLAYDNGFFDQTHFTKEFKRFTGNTPKNFVQQRKSLLHIGKIG